MMPVEPTLVNVIVSFVAVIGALISVRGVFIGSAGDIILGLIVFALSAQWLL